MTLLRPHPALKAISEQASPADQWMNDDNHRYGALRESYAFEYAVYEQADKHANTHFDFETVRHLQLVSRRSGRCRTSTPSYLHGTIPFWNSIVEHPDYDAFWKDEAWVTQVQGRLRAESQRRRLLGSGGSVGAVGDLPPLRSSAIPTATTSSSPARGSTAQWHNPSAESIGQVSFGGHDTAVEFRERIEAPWFRYWLHGTGEKFPWKASTFQTGSNSWQTYAAWPPPATRDQPLPARQRHAVVRGAAGRGQLRAVRLGSGQPGAVSARVRSRRPIRPATGGDGKSRISASSTIAPTSRPGSARRSIAT